MKEGESAFKLERTINIYQLMIILKMHQSDKEAFK